MEDKRRRLYPVMRKYQQNPNNRAALVRDKLYINGEEYILPKVTENDKNQINKSERFSERSSEDNRRYMRGTRYSQRSAVDTDNQFEVLVWV